MSSPAASKRRGRETENAVVEYLRKRYWPHAERRRLKGAKDEGDITGIPGLCIEVKGDRSTGHLNRWKRETLEETSNAGADLGILIVRRERKAVADWDVHVPWQSIQGSGLDETEEPEEWEWVCMSLRLAAEILRGMGY